VESDEEDGVGCEGFEWGMSYAQAGCPKPVVPFLGLIRLRAISNDVLFNKIFLATCGQSLPTFN